MLSQPAPGRLLELTTAAEVAAPKQFTMITQAVVDRSAMMDALAWSVQIAEHVAKVTGVATHVGTSAAGTMFQVTWIAGVDTPAELDKLNAIGTDAEYLGMLAEAGTKQLFQQGSSERVLLARMP